MKFKIFIKCLCVLFSLSISGVLNAQIDKPKLVSSVGMQFEQDVLLNLVGLSKLNTDQNYTQGFGISITSELFTEKIIERVIKINNSNGLVKRFHTNFSFALAGFTPDDLRAIEPVVGDRPYSSIFMIGIEDGILNNITHQSTKWTINIGRAGTPDVAKNIQTKIHRWMNEGNTKPPWDPKGWHNQISHGGEITALISFYKSKLLNPKALELQISSGEPPTAKRDYQFISEYGLDLIYNNRFYSGINFRFGKIDLRKWYSPLGWTLDKTAVGGQASDEIQNRIEYFGQSRIKEQYFFCGLRVSGNVYNGSLHGLFKDTKYTLDYSETGFITATGRIGVSILWTHFGFSIYGAWRSPEFWNEFSRVHSWGGFDLNVNF